MNKVYYEFSVSYYFGFITMFEAKITLPHRSKHKEPTVHLVFCLVNSLNIKRTTN